MPAKGCFENKFQDYLPGIATNHLLSDSQDSISDKFLETLSKFKANKLELLTSQLESDIFHDSSIYTGSAGLALYYVMCSNGKNDGNNHNYLKNALSYIDIDNLKGRRISFLCGDAGPLALATVISYRLGLQRPETLPDYKKLAQRLMNLIDLLKDSPDELLYGRSGYLYALLFVNKNIDAKDVIPYKHIEKVVNAILKSGKQFSTQIKSESPLMWQWHDKIYLGGAHGMAGILYLLLQARQYINNVEMQTYIKPTLDWLLSLKFSSGNFPSSLGSNSGDRLVQWCHGAPGFVPLCSLAHEVFNEEKYLKIAIKCGDVVWDRGLCTKGYSFCHGVAGNAYSFIQLYQITKKPADLYRACCFMEWCAVEREGTELHRPDRPASLFEGIVGRLYLAEELSHVIDAKFPAYTL